MANGFFLPPERRIWFGGQCSADFGILVSGSYSFNAPEREAEKITVPGRSGDLIFEDGRLKNIFIKYPASISRDFPEKALAAKAWLMAAFGYKRLEDSYTPEYFRLASFAGPIDFDVKLLNRVGETELVFDCKPQLYVKTGEHALSLIKTGQVVRNQYAFPSLPLITVHGTGNGTISVGGITVQLFSMVDTVTLDCELQDAYRDRGGILENWNGKISAPEFPVLQPGENVISWTGGVTRVEITPRWWTL